MTEIVRQKKGVLAAATKMVEIVSTAASWKKVGNRQVEGVLPLGKAILSLSGSTTIVVVIKDSRGCETMRGMFGTDTYFGNKYKEVMGC